MTRKIIGPFNRVEGDLEVDLELGDHQVESARVISPLYRGFEQILTGKDPRDAMVYTPRICGICSVAHSVASAAALADTQGLAMPNNGELATNLILATENIADHLTHFYLFFMPDFARAVYQQESWHGDIAQRFTARKGEATAPVMGARTEFMHLMGLLAGKWPHSMAIQPGGSTRPIERKEQIRIESILYAFRQFLERELFGDSLEQVASIASEDQLNDWSAQQGRGDMGRFLHLSKVLSLDKMGRGSDRFMSYGAYRFSDGHLFPGGLWDSGQLPLDSNDIREDLSHSWMEQGSEAQHPWVGNTQPDADAQDGYTWCKAPRLGGKVVEVGALARQQVAAHPLIRDLVANSGGNVQNRIIARLLEVALVVPAMERWTAALRHSEPYCVPPSREISNPQGVGLIEAARGGLGHWMVVQDGSIQNYQIIAPTTWNFSPRDSEGIPGPLEQALQGAPIRPGEQEPVSVQHIVRSFDPCMVCTVH